MARRIPPYDHRLLDRKHEKMLAEQTTLDEVIESLRGARFVYARTMPQCPHDYVLREWWTGPADFESVVAFIRQNGYESNYFTQYRQYWEWDVYQYWTMNYPPHRTKLINRSLIGDRA